MYIVATLTEETKPNGATSSPSQAARVSPTVDVAVLHCDNCQGRQVTGLIDTKGEDGPQCIHHIPVGALMAQPPPSRSCRSLQFALQI